MFWDGVPKPKVVLYWRLKLFSIIDDANECFDSGSYFFTNFNARVSVSGKTKDETWVNKRKDSIIIGVNKMGILGNLGILKRNLGILKGNFRDFF